MKTSARILYLFIGLSLFSIKSIAQKPELGPREEFAFNLSNEKIELAPSSEKKVMLTLVKSKSYNKTSAKLTANPPAGITINFTPDKGQFETSEVTLTANDQAKPGTYSLLINCTLGNKSKSVIAKIIVL